MASYFLYHSIGMFPGKADRMAAALAEVVTRWGTPDDAQWPHALEIRQRFIARWSALIGAPPGTLTTADNVTTALYSVMGSLPEGYLRGRKVLIAEDCFPSLHFLLSGLAPRRGFELVTVALRPGEYWVRDEDVLARWDESVGVALLTWVTSTASHRCDLRALTEHGHAMGSLVGVDITQGVGILPFDVSSGNLAQPDFVVGSTLKWLCGVSGAGILHLRDSLLCQCEPELRGWFSQENAFSWALDRFAYARDARRFDHGTPSILPFAACLPALDWHAAQDPVTLRAHNQRLVEALMSGCQALGLELVSPRRADERGGSAMFRLPGERDPRALVAALREQGIHVDTRGHTLRLSPGNLTLIEDVEALLRALRRLPRGPN